jgi:hypothetical protein
MPYRSGPLLWITRPHMKCVFERSRSPGFGKFPVFATKKNPQAVQAPGVWEKFVAST